MTLSTQKARVAIVRAQRYELKELTGAIQKSLSLLGGMDSFVKSGDKVFVKINHLPPPSPPERGIITHPVFTEAFLRLLKDTGAAISVGDDVEEAGEDGFALSGYREMCRRMGVRLVNLREAGFIARECKGERLKQVYVSRTVLEADAFINLPKLKTHSLCTLTGGIKNLYGCIPAGLRRRYHGEFLRIEDFCQMLVDIFAVIPPHLTVLDGIEAMEGEGPGSGQVRKLGMVLASRDTVALDAVAGRIIGLRPGEVLATSYAAERGLGVSDLAQIEIVGESLDSVTVPVFTLPATISRIVTGHAPHFLGKLAVSQISPRPHVNRKNCSGCGECVKVCPAGAATMSDKHAEINHALCIRCMCCHEVCRYNAITPRRPFPGNLLYNLIGALRKVVKI